MIVRTRIFLHRLDPLILRTGRSDRICGPARDEPDGWDVEVGTPPQRVSRLPNVIEYVCLNRTCLPQHFEVALLTAE
jgi:hypothetical protein